LRHHAAAADPADRARVAAAHVVVDGDTAHLRDSDGALERCAYPVAG
jgi:hypothetical protein